MKINQFIKIGLLLLLIPLFTLNTYAKGDKKSTDNSLKKTTGTPSSTRFNINKIGTYIYNDGRADVYGSNPGYFYPILGGKTSNFQSGFLWGGYIGDPADGKLSVGGSVYRTALTPGRILSNGKAEDPSADGVRIYRVRRDYKTGSLSQEAQDEGRSIDQVYAQYDKDWKEWPADQGAPFTYGKDASGVQRTSGSYDPNYDIPGVKGADQTIWFVANDLSTTQTQTFYGATPMGVELQCTVWGYKQSGALGQMLFKKYIMINKNAQQKAFNKFYVSYWSDTDIGGGSSDLIGADTTASLFYTFSGITDNVQYGITPPATGFDFFQGPRIPGSPQDSAVWKGKWIKGYKNLPLTAHTYFINGSTTLGDPDQNSAIGIKQWYNLFEGKGSITGAPFIDPTTGKPSKFVFSGDPVTGTGWLDSNPADRRNEGVSGPFTLAYGDTQEVVIAQISSGATPGVDNIGAVRELKRIDQIAQVAYNRFFELPEPAPMQVVKITPYDKKVVLNWAWDNVATEKTENFSYQLITPGDTSYYNFQGYNIYQLPTKSASISEAIKLKTFDIVDTVTAITDLSPNNEAGLLLPVIVANGTNSGIQRYLIDSVDAFTKLPLVNGTEYYFAVTSYSYNPKPQFGLKVLENPLVVVTVIPHSNNPGVIYSANVGSKLTVTRTGGASDGTVNITAVDPSKGTGDNYEVAFSVNSGGETVWKLTDLTKNVIVLSDQPQNQGATAPVVDGMQVQVNGPDIAIKGYTFTPSADRWLTGINWGGALLGGGLDLGINFLGSSVTPDQYVKVEVRFLSTPTGQKAYRYLRGGTPNYGYQDYTQQYFTVWDVTSSPARQLAAAYVTQKGKPTEKLPWQATADASGADREYLFILPSTYTENPDPNLTAQRPNSGVYPAMYALWPLIRTGFTFNPQAGQIFSITPNFANTTKDVFKVTGPSATNNAEVAKADVEKINVFPNPYYGVNPREVNKYSRFVTFSHLPTKATIRIFNLAGQLVRTINKDSQDQFQQWDLLTDNNFPVASGLYIVYVDMPDLSKSKILKVAIIQEQQILDHF